MQRMAATQPDREGALRMKEIQETNRLRVASDPAIGAKQDMAADSKKQSDLMNASLSPDPNVAAQAKADLNYYRSEGYKQRRMNQLLLMGLPAAETNMILQSQK